jgi:hypothetical protein
LCTLKHPTPYAHARDGKVIFGYFTDEEWDAFRRSAAFEEKMVRAEEEARQRARVEGEMPEFATVQARGEAAGLDANLNTVCSYLNFKDKMDDIYPAVVGILSAIEAAKVGKPSAAPDTFWQLLRRDFIYYSHHLGFEPKTRLLADGFTSDHVSMLGNNDYTYEGASTALGHAATLASIRALDACLNGKDVSADGAEVEMMIPPVFVCSQLARALHTRRTTGKAEFVKLHEDFGGAPVQVELS